MYVGLKMRSRNIKNIMLPFVKSSPSKIFWGIIWVYSFFTILIDIILLAVLHASVSINHQPVSVLKLQCTTTITELLKTVDSLTKHNTVLSCTVHSVRQVACIRVLIVSSLAFVCFLPLTIQTVEQELKKQTNFPAFKKHKTPLKHLLCRLFDRVL